MGGLLDDEFGSDDYWEDDDPAIELRQVERREHMARKSTPHFNTLMAARGGLGVSAQPTQPTRPAMPAAAKAPPKAAPTRKPPAAPAPPGW